MDTTQRRDSGSGPDSLICPHLRIGHASNLAMNEKIKGMVAAGKKVYHLGFGQSAFPVIPALVEAMKGFLEVRDYLPTEGILPLRQAICKFHEKYDQLKLDPNQVVVGPGTKQMIYLTLHGFNGDILLVSPTWPTYKPQAQIANKRCFVINTSLETGWKLTPQLLEERMAENNVGPNRLLILCNPDNPTGVCYTDDEFEALTVTLRRHNIKVISDEIYARNHYKYKHVSLAKHYPEGTIISSGMSKWASAGGWRVGYVIFPKELDVLKTAVKNFGSNLYSCCPAPMQFAVTKMLSEEKAIDSYIEHTTRILVCVCDCICRQFRAVGAKLIKPEGAHYLFPDLEVLRPALARRGIHTGEEMCDAILEECNVAVMPGGPAFLRPNEELTIRLCFVNFDGAKALAGSRELGLDKPLDERFVKEYCTPTYDGVRLLCEWAKKQLE